MEYYIWVCIRIILDSKRTTSYALDVNGIRFDMLCDYDKRDPAPNNHHIQVIVPAYTGGLVTIRIPFHGMGWLCPSKSWVFQAFNRNDTLGMDQRRVTRTPPKILLFFFVSLHPFTQRTILGFFPTILFSTLWRLLVTPVRISNSTVGVASQESSSPSLGEWGFRTAFRSRCDTCQRR